jgi:hypothetical protein
LRVVDQIVYPRPFLRAKVKDGVIVAVKILCFPQIIVVFIGKTPCEGGRCDGKNQHNGRERS